jgi:hypothetical protein
VLEQSQRRKILSNVLWEDASSRSMTSVATARLPSVKSTFNFQSIDANIIDQLPDKVQKQVYRRVELVQVNTKTLFEYVVKLFLLIRKKQ